MTEFMALFVAVACIAIAYEMGRRKGQIELLDDFELWLAAGEAARHELMKEDE